MTTTDPWVAPPAPPEPRTVLFNEDAYRTPLTAAGMVLAGGDEATNERAVESRFGSRKQVQDRIWGFRAEIGELANAITFYENCFSRIRLTVAVEEEDGSRSSAFNPDGTEAVPGAAEALAYVRQLRSPIGGQSALMRSLGGCLAAVGECHLVGEADPRMPGGQAFHIYSPSEFFASGKRPGGRTEYTHLAGPGAAPRKLTEDDVYVARIWQPDPQYTHMAWAAPLAMCDIFDELVLLTREVAGAVRSRLALAGIMLVADDISFPTDPNAPVDSAALDPLSTLLIKTAGVAIRDKSSASGVIPIVLRVPATRVADTADQNGEQGFRLMEPDRKWDDRASDKRTECVMRFAQGMDAPPEVVTGHGNTTFANAAQISADTYRNYIQPKAMIGTDGLTMAYLRVKMPGSPFVIDADPTDLVIAPDQSANYREAYKAFAVSGSAYRNSFGATDDDAPTDEELAVRVAIESAIRARTPLTPGETTANEAAITAAAEVEVMRAMHRIGARLRSKVSGKPGLASMIRNVPDTHVAATLGPREVERLMTDAELFGREFDVLASFVAKHADGETAEAVRAAARTEAARRLYEPEPVG